MDSYSLGQAMRSGDRIYGTMIMSPSPHWPGRVAQLGLDFVFIDTEHVSLGRSELAWMCQTYRALDLAPIVRIPSPDPFQASMVLDGGAAGVLAPYIETVEQVTALRGAVKLRPLKGQKLDDVLSGTLTLDPAEAEYLANFNRENLLLLNIESQAAIDNLDTLLSVPGVDGVVIGPHDLSISLGLPEQYDHPKFDQAVRTIISTARRHGAGAGNHFSYGVDPEIAWAQAGMNIVLHNTDIGGFLRAIGDDINQIKRALGDDTGEGPGHVDI
jgi:4-hydroxy-2-oxoheptanedioate aldolase